MDQKELFQKMREIMASGDEKETKNFLIENFSQLPKDIQRKTAAFLMEDGLEKVSQKKVSDLERKMINFEELNVILKEAMVKDSLDSLATRKE